MKQMCLLSLYLLMLPFQVASQTCEWSELIGKDLVLYRYGRLKDGIFTDYRFTNPAGARPVETLTLTDSTHFEWKYSLSGDFKREIELKGTKMDLLSALLEQPLYLHRAAQRQCHHDGRARRHHPPLLYPRFPAHARVTACLPQQ